MTNTITKLHFNGVDYDLGGKADIHSLPEKTKLTNADELILADSETSFTNKRIQYGNFVAFPIYSSFNQLGRSDNIDGYGVASSGSTMYLTNRGVPIKRNGTIQQKSVSGSGYMVFNGKIYYSIVSSNVCYIYSCSVENDITNNANWTEATHFSTTSTAAGLLGFDGTYIVVIEAGNPNKIHQFDTNFNLQHTLTLDGAYYNGSYNKCACGTGKYLLYNSNDNYDVEYFQDGTKSDIAYHFGTRNITVVGGFLYVNYSQSNYPRVPQCRY